MSPEIIRMPFSRPYTRSPMYFETDPALRVMAQPSWGKPWEATTRRLRVERVPARKRKEVFSEALKYCCEAFTSRSETREAMSNTAIPRRSAIRLLSFSITFCGYERLEEALQLKASWPLFAIQSLWNRNDTRSYWSMRSPRTEGRCILSYLRQPVSYRCRTTRQRCAWHFGTCCRKPRLFRSLQEFGVIQRHLERCRDPYRLKNDFSGNVAEYCGGISLRVENKLIRNIAEGKISHTGQLTSGALATWQRKMMSKVTLRAETAEP